MSIDNTASAHWTVVEIPAHKARGNLRALLTALASHRFEIGCREISQQHGIRYLRLLLRQRHGGKIASPEAQQDLHCLMSVTQPLLRKFIPFLSEAPEPDMALRHFESFVEHVIHNMTQQEHYAWLWQPSTLQVLAMALGSSDFLWTHCLRQPYAPSIVANPAQLVQSRTKQDFATGLRQLLGAYTSVAEQYAAFKAFKSQELLRLFLRHLLHHELPFGTFARELTDLADVVLAEALHLTQQHLHEHYGTPRLANGHPCPITLFGLGKLGGRELGYASDFDMLYVYGDQAITNGVQRLTIDEYMTKLIQHMRDLVVETPSGLFSMDICLRPYGNQSSLAVSYDALHRYYHPDGSAAFFERQALTRLRWIAGDTSLGYTVEAWRDRFVYSTEPVTFQEVARLRRQQRDELVRPAYAINLKYSEGGLVDVEYIVQYLQLQHGAAQRTIRCTNILEAMEALQHADVLSGVEAEELQSAYRYLRRSIDALRMVRGRALDLVVPDIDSEEFAKFSRRLHASTPTNCAQTLAQHMQCVAKLVQRYGTEGSQDTFEAFEKTLRVSLWDEYQQNLMKKAPLPTHAASGLMESALDALHQRWTTTPPEYPFDLFQEILHHKLRDMLH
jgi:glutamate-ammonia-ligase adenylyltransferase